MVFDGTFNSGLSSYPIHYFTPGSVTQISSQEERYQITPRDNIAGDGHYRGDILSPNVYPAGVAECTSVPINLVDLPTVPNDSWFQFAEAKDTRAQLAGWEMDVTSYFGGQNEFSMSFDGYQNDRPPWHSGPITPGWHTLSICTNDANNSSGEVYGIWLDGVRQTLNDGPNTGAQSLSGFPIIDDGTHNWPLDINDYTGGGPAPNEIIHGAPLIATSNTPGDPPPEPAGGWQSP
jgi:hypothetical protein